MKEEQEYEPLEALTDEEYEAFVGFKDRTIPVRARTEILSQEEWDAMSDAGRAELLHMHACPGRRHSELSYAN